MTGSLPREIDAGRSDAASGHLQAARRFSTLTVVIATLALAGILSVPFVAQREATCGPASLAMVLSFWGEEVDQDELAEGVMEPGDAGVRGRNLVALAEARGFRAIAFAGDMALASEYLARGWPLVVAIDAGRGRYHDVVIIGFEGGFVVVHDPARGPARRVKRGAFEKKWEKSGHWTLLVLPGEVR